ncbi:MAG: sucrose-specific PTS transporter subunit IIBC [Oscillospiraceae bacterium]|nr:sucrose-specific PTS transporter subunit IIBC [Oscillospiraceae bacterium]
MNYNACAKDILSAIGGKENIVSAAHCATRLRLVIANDEKVNKNKLENTDGVKGVFSASGQLQVIIGTGAVNKVYDEFISQAGIAGGTKETVKQAAMSKAPWYKRAVKTLGDIFVPIIPAIVASGLLMGLLEGFTNLFPSLLQSDTYTVFHLFSNTAFVFLPILIAVSAAKTFGGNPYLGAVIGMIMIHPDLLNAWSVAGAESVPTAGVWFGLYDINLVGYQGHVIPVVIAVWFMSFIEKRLHRIVPEILDLFITPLVTVLVTGYLTLTVFGPVFSWLENGILSSVKWLIAIPFGIGSALCGAIYAPTVVGGIHHMYNALEAGMLSADGVNKWMPIATAANVAQGAAALAFSIRTSDRKQKAVALPASLSAFLGITEPAIFGVNLRFMRPFIAGCIGGAAGGLVAGLFSVGATAYGITGVFGVLITTNNILQYLLVMGVSFAVSFILTLFLYKKENHQPQENTENVQPVKVSADTSDSDPLSISSPLTGNAVFLSDVPDPTFSEGILGLGAAVEPLEGKVCAPCKATVSTLFDTHHAIGLTLENGAELLIHIGINTVELNGEGFTALVNEGESVEAGQTLITFDPDFIASKGYKTITPVIVTNPDEFSEISQAGTGSINVLEKLILLKQEK